VHVLAEVCLSTSHVMCCAVSVSVGDTAMASPVDSRPCSL
jgi:hypothetical protein